MKGNYAICKRCGNPKGHVCHSTAYTKAFGVKYCKGNFSKGSLSSEISKYKKLGYSRQETFRLIYLKKKPAVEQELFKFNDKFNELW